MTHLVVKYFQQEQSSQVQRYHGTTGERNYSDHGPNITLINPEVHVHNRGTHEYQFSGIGHPGTQTTIYSSATQSRHIRVSKKKPLTSFITV